MSPSRREQLETIETRDRITDQGVFLRPPPGRGWRVIDAHRERFTTWQRRVERQRPINGAAIIRRCRAGASLYKAHDRGGAIFTLRPPGTKVKTRYAHRAISSGMLRPMSDGLFGFSSQTWIYATSPTPIARVDAARARTVSTSAAKGAKT
jgi:hypothetical protein